MTTTVTEHSPLTPNAEFAQLASEEQIARATAALEANGFRVIVAENAGEARQAALDLLPEGAEVFNATSRTLESLGLAGEIERSGRYDAVRPKLYQMDRRTQACEMRKLGAAPDVVIGSVHAITEQGQVLIASGSGSQLPAYAHGAGQVIWVASTQKIVPTLDAGMRRLQEYSYPLEDVRARRVYGQPSALAKVLLINRERPGRITIILVKEPLGF